MERVDLGTIFEALSDVGFDADKPEDGRDCLAYTVNEDVAHDVFANIANGLVESAKGKGLEVRLEVDSFGNSYAVLVGSSEREIMICSHLDSVPRGGRFDGVVGVSAGLDIIRRLINDGIKPAKTIIIAAFRAEESSVTGCSCLGSSLATGNFNQASLDRVHDTLRISLREMLSRRGADFDNTSINGDRLDGVVEVHIEQSSVLESLDMPVGIVVNGIGGARRSDFRVESDDAREVHNGKILKVTVNGEAGHSGGLPMNGEVISDTKMDLRRDAVAVTARFLSSLQGAINLVSISVPGGNYNTVPGKCCFEVAVADDFDVDVFRGQIEGVLLDGMSVEISSESREVGKIRDNVALAAMKIISECEAAPSGGLVRTTVGDVMSGNDGAVVLRLDQRRLDNEVADLMNERIADSVGRVAQEHGVRVNESNVVTSLATPLSRSVAQLMRDAAEALGYGELPEMGSMPGHDSAKVIRAKRADGQLVGGGMVFIRGRNRGISHNPRELSDMSDIEKAVDLLYATVKKMAV